MPTPHFTRRQLRRTTAVTLLAWGFALLSGVVNACQIQPSVPGQHSSAVAVAGAPVGGASGPGAPRHIEPGHHAAGAEHDRPVNDAGQAGCLKFCADESSVVAKSKTAQPDLPGLAVMVSSPWRSATSVASAAPWWSLERPASQGPPLVIRLLRLTI
jgi:hypothetical protein